MGRSRPWWPLVDSIVPRGYARASGGPNAIERPAQLTYHQRPSVTTVSMISSAFVLGAWLGSSLLIFVFGFSLGRRTWLLIGNVVGITGTLIAVTSFSTGQMIAGRVLLVSLARSGVFLRVTPCRGLGPVSSGPPLLFT